MSSKVRISSLIVVAVFVAAGLSVALAFLPLFIALGVLAGLGVLCVRDEELQSESGRSGCDRERLAMIVGTAVVFACFAAIGMTVLWGGASAALVAVAALAVFALHRQLGGSTRNGESAAVGGGRPDEGSRGAGRVDARSTLAAPSAPLLLTADPTSVGLDDLCRAWRLSYLLLQKARGPDELEHATWLRRRYLDELARRHPEGFRRWLDEGARAADDPSPHLGQPSSPPEHGEDAA